MSNKFFQWFVMTVILMWLITLAEPVILPIIDEISKTTLAVNVIDFTQQVTPMFLIVVFYYAIIRGIVEDET